jgi:signal transduction histidine kinase
MSMSHLSIRARLIFLSLLLLVILAVSSTLLIRELGRHSQSLAEQARLVSIVRTATAASKHFGDLKYWLTDLAITQLASSQQNAAAAKARLDEDLKAMAAVGSEGVAAIGREVDTLTKLARRAGEAYSGDDSAEGNALLAQARSRIVNIDDEIDTIVASVEQQALAGRDASAREAERVVNFSITGGMVTLAVALGLTALIVRSITVPLKRLEGSMAAITRGELDTQIPRASAHEIGAMTRTLGMLRDSLIERDHLERERRRADAEIRSARDAAEAALRDLKAAQANLIQAEKMASLGQLTAGIAHEIKNPLNFVNNFSAISAELTSELQEALRGADLDGKLRAEIGEITDTLRGNLDKIVQHGKRADEIVKNMLLHSRHGSGEHRPVDINAVVEESLNLAYHGARAEKQGFNIALQRSFDPAAGEVDLFPQEITRVLLNLMSNGFYAAAKRKAEVKGGGYEPTLAVATKNLGDSIEIRIRDNGTGVSPEVKEKMFDPFFTTKPAGEGTGLGLSLSYDIIVKQHGGSIEVETEPGEYTEFRIILPRSAASFSGAGRQA